MTDPRVSEGLGRQLWEMVETPQGRSFVSDDFCTLPDAVVVAFCLNQLPAARRVVRAFEKISKGYKLANDQPVERK